MKENMVENDDVEKKKNDDGESDNVESEDELDDKNLLKEMKRTMMMLRKIERNM